MLIFEHSAPQRPSQWRHSAAPALAIDADFLRDQPLPLPQLSELQVVRHYTQLAQQNFCIDSHFYPLGSCTMKYNPKVANQIANLAGFIDRHPLAPLSHSQGYLSCVYDLQQWLAELTGMAAVSLTPMAGAQGEFAGVSMIKAYHQAHQQAHRVEMIVPDTAHGTNPASAVMCGYQIKECPTQSDGDLDLAALSQLLGPNTAGVMLTNPSTLGLFERQIDQISQLVHQAGGLMYYDGANLNAILGQVRPADMGFDVMHINLHKTFATPHGGGGPGAGPVAANALLAPYLPVPRADYVNGQYRWLNQQQCPQSIGQLSGFMGNAGVLIRALAYIRQCGGDGLSRVSELATLNANYLMAGLAQANIEVAYPQRRASHEFIISFKQLTKQTGVTAMDIAKGLLDYGIHAPTTYFPLLVPECFLIEPTETESKATLDRFIQVLVALVEQAKQDPQQLKQAPHRCPVGRLDDVLAARQLAVCEPL